MKKKGIIEACKSTGCGFKCCSFGSTKSNGSTILLPGEYENAKGSVSHLQVLDDNYFGGKKVRCIAKEPFCCDGGYKPIQCRVYPLWISSIKDKLILKSLKCPLKEDALTNHLQDAFHLFEEYPYTSREELELFLSKVKVDRYKVYGSQECDGNVDIRILSQKDLECILNYEETLNDCNTCFKSREGVVSKCIDSGFSIGIFVDNTLSAYTLSYSNEYGINYIEKCFVSPEYRGQGWQVTMLLKHNELVKSIGTKFIFSMASPSNWVSIRSFKQVGFKEAYPTSVGGYNRIVFVYKCSPINGDDVVVEAKKMIDHGYVYLFGGKGNVITSEYIKHMSEMYKDVFSPDIIELSNKKIGKVAVDCSGFVSIATKTSYGDSLGIFSHLVNPIRVTELKTIKNGMILYKKGHVGIVCATGNGFVIEAKDTKADIVCSPFDKRAKDFDFCGELEGVSYDNVNSLEL